MAITWGSWAGPSGERVRVGIDATVIGTAVNLNYYVEAEARINDAQKLTRTGSVTGSVNYTLNKPAGGGTQKVSSYVFNGSRGASYTFGAKVSGVYTGASPSHTRTVAIPVTVPSAPGKPTLSNQTATGVTVTVAAPSSNGGAGIVEYLFQRATNSAFTGANDIYRSGRSATIGTDPNTTYYFRARARNSAGWSPWSATTSTKTPPLPPAEPNMPSVSRVNDSRINLTWTNLSSPIRPYANILVQRHEEHDGRWVTVATLAGTATSYADTTVQFNSRYTYRIAARNAAGTSEWVPGNTMVETTPAAPIYVNPRRNTSGILVEIGPAGPYQRQHRILHQAGSGSWTQLAVLPTNQLEFQHNSPNVALTHRYRVQAMTSVGPTLYSTTVDSPIVNISAPPYAPTSLGPNGPVDVDALEGVHLTWTHNTGDSSPQTEFEIRGRLAGTSSWQTYPVGSSASSFPLEDALDAWGLTPTNGNTLEWQVRTWGVNPTAGPWSATKTLAFSSTPTVTISAPESGDTWEAPTLTIDWVYFQGEASPQAEWQAELINSTGQRVEIRSGAGSAQQVVFTQVIPDRTEWTVRVRAQSGTGLWSAWATSLFSVDYPEPARPDLDVEYRPDEGSVEIFTRNPDPPAETFQLHNTYTNPGFEVAQYMNGEVRRNYYQRPFMDSLDGIVAEAGAEVAVVEGGISFTSTGFSDAVDLSANIAALTSGTYSIGLDMASELGAPFYVEISAGGVVLTEIPFLTTYERLTGTFTLTSSGSITVRIVSVLEGYTAVISRPVIERGTVAGPYFDGSTTSTDPDWTNAWAGTPNNSASHQLALVPELVHASTPGTTLQTGIQSTLWAHEGTHSLRVLPGGFGNAHVGPSSDPHTIVAVCRVTNVDDEDTPDRRAMIAQFLTGPRPSVQAPNEVGVHIVRMVVDYLPQYLLLTGQAGSDVWWDALTVIPGVHPDAPPFTGSSPSFTNEAGYHVSTEWDGDPNESATTASFDPAPMPVSNSVYRSIDGGPWVLIADEVPLNGVVFDPLPHLTLPNLYKVVAYTDAPAAAESRVAELVTGPQNLLFVNWGAGFGEFVKVYGNIARSGATSRSRTLHQFAGRSRPVAFFGEAGSQSVTIAARITPDASPLEAWEAGVHAAEVVCLRDPASGRRMFGAIDGFTHQHGAAKGIVEIGFTVQEVDYDE